MKKPVAPTTPVRRLSPIRVLLGLIILACMAYGSMFGMNLWKQSLADSAYRPWFGAYVDVTATPSYAFEQPASLASKNVVLSFIVSDPNDPCTPTGGGVDNLDGARGNLDLDRRIARLKQLEGSIAISFGGLLHDELALKCTDPNQLLNAYESVVNRYDIDTIDLDLEGAGLTDRAAANRRAEVIAKLQAKRRAAGKTLSVWLTLPVAPQGLTKDGTDAVATMLAKGVDLAGVNVMTMDYGNSRVEGQSMLDASKSALNETHRQLGILYQQHGTNLTDGTLWKKIGATPMIGKNDTGADIFTLADAKGLNAFAISKGIGRMSMWSANRDITCGENYVDISIVSDACSGVKQDKLGFTKTLSAGFSGKLKNNVQTIKKENLKTKADLVDDPEKSPYQIWMEKGTYLKGTKVVWHHNVYEAKWWTQNDQPDNPVLESYNTPWQLLGPVLPGEKPLPQPTLPAGTYPDWSGKEEYEGGMRVLLNGVPYQAKWWTKGDSPEATTADPDSSAWVPLTQDQVEQILKGL
jgi:chitinase